MASWSKLWVSHIDSDFLGHLWIAVTHHLQFQANLQGVIIMVRSRGPRTSTIAHATHISNLQSTIFAKKVVAPNDMLICWSFSSIFFTPEKEKTVNCHLYCGLDVANFSRFHHPIGHRFYPVVLLICGIPKLIIDVYESHDIYHQHPPTISKYHHI